MIVENAGARRLYEKLGFEHVRLLDVWRLAGEPDGGATVAAEEAHALVQAQRTWREPWQRTDATLERLREVGPPPRGVVADGAAAVVRITKGLATIVQLATPSDDAYDRLLERIRGLGETVLLMNLPDDDPASGALRRLAGDPAIRQHEMLLEL